MATTDDATNTPDLPLIDAFLSKLSQFDKYELCSQQSSHWMLSTNDFKVPTEPPLGIITSMIPISGNSSVVLLPTLDNSEDDVLDIRLIHQMIRELTFGIYALNSMPACSLEANYDQSTQCQLPPAYIDTKVGQLMIHVDYIMKSLWHGAYMPTDKRKAFTDVWRTNLVVNTSTGKPETKKPIITEFISAGTMDITKDPEYANVYDNLKTMDTDAEEAKFFMNHVDDMAMIMTIYQRAIIQHRNLFLIDADWIVSSNIRTIDEKVDKNAYERLHNRLQLHELIINEYLSQKKETAFNLQMMKLISFLVPWLVGMKKRMKIPNLKTFLPNLKGDEVRTERELPPLIQSPDFKCKNFMFGPERYFHLHGCIQFDHETPSCGEVPEELAARHDEILEQTIARDSSWLDPNTKPPQDNVYPAEIVTINGKRYHAIAIQFETYYHQQPQKPPWVCTMSERIGQMRLKTMTEHDVHDVFRKHFGTKKAINYKNQLLGLSAAARRGLVATFNTLARKCPPSRLGKQDDNGLSLLHHAAMNNRPHVIAQLILHSMDVNVRKSNNIQISGPTALHLAARCGSFEAATCLVANYANLLATDQDGWVPAHYAAFYDNVPILKLLIGKESALLEFQTKDDSGALEALKCLLDLGAYVQRKDDMNNNVIEVAAMRFHTNVLEFFIDWDHPEVPVWEIIVGMLKGDDLARKDSAVKCIDVLAISREDNWKEILNAGGVPAVVSLLYLNDERIQAVAVAVLCSISQHQDVRLALCQTNAGPILIQLLSSPNDDIQARASIVVADMACIEGQQELLSSQGAISPLVNLLDSEIEDVLVYAVNAIKMMSQGCPDIQTEAAKGGVIEPLVEFLSIHSEKLQASASSAIAAVSGGHKDNQDTLIKEGVVKPLIKLIKGHQVTAQVQAACALEALCDGNSSAQLAFMEEDGPKALLKLFKYWSVQVREQGACALWSLAGDKKKQQKEIANHIGLHRLIEMLLATSEKLQYVGCMAMNALGYEDMEEQNKIVKQDGIGPLVRLLRSPKTSERVLLIVIQLIGTLCIGVAHRNNKVSQKRMSEENSIPSLVQLIISPPNDDIKVEAACTLACVVLGNSSNQQLLKMEETFDISYVLELLYSPIDRIRLRAGFALSLFAFNNTTQQYAVKEAGGLEYSFFRSFLKSEDDLEKCNSAFQMVVLSRVVNDRDQVSLTAEGISMLVEVLKSKNDSTVSEAASLIASVAHTRTGIPDALVTVGVMDVLISKINRESDDYSRNEHLRFMCATALGYMTFHRPAMRILLTACRSTPKLFESYVENLGKDFKASQEFFEEFERCKAVGMPCLSLEKYGGPPILGKKNVPMKRPLTTQTRKATASRPIRVTSAPPRSLRTASNVTSMTVSRPPTSGNTSRITIDENPSKSVFKSRLSAWGSR
ncbi:DgyrCDS3724 [Dimorphilus gyrociliatus]|uniref:DgyrCDS3724 n=1 Tax=Dimorphilus gyrociliatus TaxID=2664684 RepID=A0A7I8VHE4_9ANNE|nr:DgyrCDS3724 [Dimorphilus gyrociliatus]